MKINKELLKGSTATIVLQTLSTKKMYGYEMIKTIEENTDNVFSLKEGTLYPLLHKLEAEHYITSFWKTVDGRKRKYYEITKDGEKLLQEKKKEWHVFKEAIDKNLGGSFA